MSVPPGSLLRHLGGLAFAAGLLALAWALWGWVPTLLRGTPLADLSLIMTVLAWIAVLTAGDHLWDRMTGRKGH